MGCGSSKAAGAVPAVDEGDGQPNEESKEEETPPAGGEDAVPQPEDQQGKPGPGAVAGGRGLAKPLWTPSRPASAEHDLRAITLQDLEAAGSIPPASSAALKPIASFERTLSFTIFVSHRWMRPEAGLPDTERNAKWKIIVEGAKAFKEKHLLEETTICLWIDYSCISERTTRSDTEALIQALPYYVYKCDGVMSVIVDSESPDREVSQGLGAAIEASDYGSEAWCSHWTRSWCRLEALLAAHLPAPRDSPVINIPDWATNTSQPRPHIAIGQGGGLHFVQPLDNKWIQEHSPMKGDVTNETDRSIIEQILQDLQPHLQIGAYDGETDAEGRRSGQGTCEFAAGGRYAGGWKEGQMDGNGEYTFPWGDAYKGDYKEGMRDGHGEYTYASTNMFVGSFKADKRHGLGTYTYASGAEYEGAFAFDQRHGHGKYRFVNGDIYEGDYVRGQMHGQGTLVHADGSKYDGQWTDGKMHGRGTLTLYNGSRYLGEYRNGKMHGTGTYTFANNDIFRGEYEDGHMRRGMFLFANGDRYDGDFRGGKMHGKGKFESAQGDTYDGDFDNDLKHGHGIMRLSSGASYEGGFKQGKKHGTGLYCSAGGVWIEGLWANGKRIRYQRHPEGEEDPLRSLGTLQESVSVSPDGRPARSAGRTPGLRPTSGSSPSSRTGHDRSPCGHRSSSGLFEEPIAAERPQGRIRGLKGPTFVQKRNSTLPPDRPLYRTKGGTESLSSPGDSTHQQPRPLRPMESRIPARLLLRLGADSSLAISTASNPAVSPRRRARNLGLFDDYPPQTVPSVQSLHGDFRRQPRPSSAPAVHAGHLKSCSRPRSAAPRMQRHGTPAERSQKRRMSGRQAPGSHEVQRAATPSMAWQAPKQSPPPANFVRPRSALAQAANDPEVQGWLVGEEDVSGSRRKPHTYTISPEKSFDLEPYSHEMTLQDAAAAEFWHPDIPRPPSVISMNPHDETGRFWGNEIEGPYSRSRHLSLDMIAELV